ncbi:MAG: Crp/Fnr family transcriptional regulator [Candidatus Saccharimonadaceae bacterium]
MNQTILDKITQFFSTSSIKTYTKGEIVTFADQDPEGVSFLLDGVIEQYDITAEGNKITVNIFKQPAFFPMSWAINKTPNTYFYAALTDVRVRQASAEKTVAFLKENPDVTFDLLSRVYKGTDALLKRLTLAAIGVASSRLVFELLIESYRFGTDMGDGKRSVKIKQNNLASRSGLARETVSRELHKLEKDGSVTFTKEGIILDIKNLESGLDMPSTL